MEFNDYPKMSIATDVVIFAVEDIKTDDNRKVPEKGIQVLLLRRNLDCFTGKWSLPGGFVDIDKDIYEAAKDKLLLKTGINNLYMEQLYTYGNPNRDPRGRVVSVAYMSLVEKKNVNMHDAMWFWVVPKRDKNGTVVDVCFESEDRRYETRDLAFDHINIVIDALNRIQNKVEYTDIAFNLLPSQFTVKELEMVYQCIVGHKIQGFRRKMGDKIITTQIMKDDGSAHRPAEYYQYNKNHTQKF